MKTIREDAEEYYSNNIFCDGITEFEHDIAIRCYIAGAKWQAERMYSKEDMKACWTACLDFNKPAGFDNGVNFDDFIKQAKGNCLSALKKLNEFCLLFNLLVLIWSLRLLCFLDNTL